MTVQSSWQILTDLSLDELYLCFYEFIWFSFFRKSKRTLASYLVVWRNSLQFFSIGPEIWCIINVSRILSKCGAQLLEIIRLANYTFFEVTINRMELIGFWKLNFWLSVMDTGSNFLNVDLYLAVFKWEWWIL